jgi:miniconductance mechanosensitive channel
LGLTYLATIKGNDNFMDHLEVWLDQLLKGIGIVGSGLPYIRTAVLLTLVVFIAYLSFYITKYVVIRAVHAFFIKTETKLDDILVENKVLSNLALLIPGLIIKNSIPLVLSDYEIILPFILKITDIYIVIVFIMTIMSLVNGLEAHLALTPMFRNKPLASYTQLSRIIIYIVTGIFILSILMGQSPLYFLSAFGAMTAILLLIFKDTILGLVASVQISSNDMIRVGDWVEMPKFDANGHVLAINLNTVKISNWDKTVTTVPTFYFITDSFKNWRGMQESGGRRIKRSIYINLRSIKFVDKDLRQRFERFHLITDFVKNRQEEIEAYNALNNVDTSELINGRRMTNIGVFRQYTERFLRTHAGINQNMTILVRQLQPEANGLPLEVYCFTKSVAWAEYETVQADLFDHLLAAANHYDLEVFQNPSGNDIMSIGKQLAAKQNL